MKNRNTLSDGPAVQDTDPLELKLYRILGYKPKLYDDPNGSSGAKALVLRKEPYPVQWERIQQLFDEDMTVRYIVAPLPTPRVLVDQGED